MGSGSRENPDSGGSKSPGSVPPRPLADPPAIRRRDSHLAVKGGEERTWLPTRFAPAIVWPRRNATNLRTSEGGRRGDTFGAHAAAVRAELLKTGGAIGLRRDRGNRAADCGSRRNGGDEPSGVWPRQR